MCHAILSTEASVVDTSNTFSKLFDINCVGKNQLIVEVFI